MKRRLSAIKFLKDYLLHLKTRAEEGRIPAFAARCLRILRLFVVPYSKLAKHLSDVFNEQNRRAKTAIRLIDQVAKTSSMTSLGYVGPYSPGALERLLKITRGLHDVLSHKWQTRLSFGVVIPFVHSDGVGELPDPKLFRKTLESACFQTCPDYEILVVTHSDHHSMVRDLVRPFQDHYQNLKLRVIEFSQKPSALADYLNVAFAQVSKQWILVLPSGDWIRPDFFYRIEQTFHLKAIKDPKTVFYVDEFNMDDFDGQLGHFFQKPDYFEFPFIFSNRMRTGFVAARTFWSEILPLNPKFAESGLFDVFVRFARLKAKFVRVPVPLYGKRLPEPRVLLERQRKALRYQFLSLEDNLALAGLNWSVGPGQNDFSFGLSPQLPVRPLVQVIIPFKDLKDMTLRCVRSLKDQVDVELLVTTIDNQSEDRSIGEEIKKLDHEVIEHNESFNYSRINNRAVRESRYRGRAPYILFLNNDVILNPDAISQMIKWAQYDRVGVVGTKLLYPEGLIQHGGVKLDPGGPFYLTSWQHVDYQVHKSLGLDSSSLSLVEAVTGACMLMRTADFERMGGFDEIIYPVAFSDTDLCFRMRKAGKLVVYTPFAEGVHFESLSREKEHLEDFENLTATFLQKHYPDVEIHY